MSRANALRSMVIVSILSVILAFWLGRQGIVAAGFVGVLITFGMLFDRANTPSGYGPFPNIHVSYRPRPPLSETREPTAKKVPKMDPFWTALATGFSLVLVFNRFIF